MSSYLQWLSPKAYENVKREEEWNNLIEGSKLQVAHQNYSSEINRSEYCNYRDLQSLYLLILIIGFVH